GNLRIAAAPGLARGPSRRTAQRGRLVVPGAAPDRVRIQLLARIVERIILRRPRVEVRLVEIGRPLGDVAVHVVQPEGVGLLLSADVRLSVAVRPVPGVLVERRRVVAERVGRRRAGPCGVLPLRFGRQTVLPSGAGRGMPLTGWSSLPHPQDSSAYGGVGRDTASPASFGPVRPSRRFRRRSRLNANSSKSFQVISLADMKNGLMETRCCGPSSGWRPGSFSGLPIRNSPPGMGTISMDTFVSGIDSTYGASVAAAWPAARGAASAASIAAAAPARAALREMRMKKL